MHNRFCIVATRLSLYVKLKPGSQYTSRCVVSRQRRPFPTRRAGIAKNPIQHVASETASFDAKCIVNQALGMWLAN